MTVALTLDAALAALVVAVAIWTIVVRETFAAVAGFVGYGLLLTLIWMRLGAVDVALTEAAIGSGLTGILLLGAETHLRTHHAAVAVERPGAVVRCLALVLSAGVATALAVAVLLLPDPAPTLAPVAAENAAATGVGNPVTNVLIAFRAMDTMLEKIVLLLALVGVWSLASDRVWGGRPWPAGQADPQSVLTFFAQLLAPIGVVVGVYILWVGADRPGGAFQGGTILAAMWLLTISAGLVDTPATGGQRLRLVLTAGPVIFLVVGFGGLVLGDAFLAYPVAFAKPLVLVIEFAMTLTIAVTLALLLTGPPTRAGQS